MIIKLTCPDCGERILVSDKNYPEDDRENPCQYRPGTNMEECPNCGYNFEFEIVVSGEVEDVEYE